MPTLARRLSCGGGAHRTEVTDAAWPSGMVALSEPRIRKTLTSPLPRLAAKRVPRHRCHRETQVGIAAFPCAVFTALPLLLSALFTGLLPSLLTTLDVRGLRRRVQIPNCDGAIIAACGQELRRRTIPIDGCREYRRRGLSLIAARSNSRKRRRRSRRHACRGG